MKIAILARLDALSVFTIRIDDTGIQIGFASDKKEAPMAVAGAQLGQVEIAPVGQEHSAPQVLGLRPVVVFGLGIRTQGNGDGGILQQKSSVQWSSTAAGLTAVKRPGNTSARASWRANELPS